MNDWLRQMAMLETTLGEEEAVDTVRFRDIGSDSVILKIISLSYDR